MIQPAGGKSLADYALGHGIAPLRSEARAFEDGFTLVDIDMRETRLAAIALCETLGYTHWATYPRYAGMEGILVQCVVTTKI